MSKVEIDGKLIEKFVKACIELGINTITEMAEKINEKEKD